MLKEMVIESKPIILEPVMNIEISTPSKILQHIINDLVAQRRGMVDVIEEDQNRFGKQRSDRQTIKGVIPL